MKYVYKNTFSGIFLNCSNNYKKYSIIVYVDFYWNRSYNSTGYFLSWLACKTWADFPLDYILIMEQ